VLLELLALPSGRTGRTEKAHLHKSAWLRRDCYRVLLPPTRIANKNPKGSHGREGNLSTA